MTAQTIETMYHEQPVDDWLYGVPAELRPLVDVPAWATDCHAEGWTDPKTFAWLPEDAPEGVFSFYFAMKIKRGVRVYSADRGRDVEMRVSLTQAGHLTRRQGRQATYRTEPLKVSVGFDADDDYEMSPDSALTLLAAMGEVLTPIRPSGATRRRRG